MYPELEPSEDRELDPRFGGKNAGKVPETPLSARLFAPVEWDLCSRWPTVCYKRHSVFLWEHAQLRPCKLDTYRLMILSRYLEIFPFTDRLVKLNNEFNERTLGFPFTKTVTRTIDDDTTIHEGYYVPWQCILFDLAYIFAVFFYLRWIYRSNTRAWIFPFAVVALLLLFNFCLFLMLPRPPFNYIDYCWLYQTLYIINVVITITLIYHATSWLLRSIFRRIMRCWKRVVSFDGNR